MALIRSASTELQLGQVLQAEIGWLWKVAVPMQYHSMSGVGVGWVYSEEHVVREGFASSDDHSAAPPEASFLTKLTTTSPPACRRIMPTPTFPATQARTRLHTHPAVTRCVVHRVSGCASESRSVNVLPWPVATSQRSPAAGAEPNRQGSFRPPLWAASAAARMLPVLWLVTHDS